LGCTVQSSGNSNSQAQRQAQFNTIDAYYSYVYNTANGDYGLANPDVMLQYVDANVIYRRLENTLTVYNYVDLGETLFSNLKNSSTSYLLLSGNHSYKQYTSDGNIVSLAVDIEFVANPNNVHGASVTFSKIYMTEFLTIAFNAAGKMQYIDSTSTLEGLYTTAGFDFYNSTNWGYMRYGICAMAMGNPMTPTIPGLCTSANTGYTDFNDCMAYLRTVPNGLPATAAQNNLLCRFFMEDQVVNRPAVNCPTLGKQDNRPNCIDSNSYIAEYTNYPFPPGVFVASGPGNGNNQVVTSAGITTAETGTGGSVSQAALIAGVTATVATIVGIIVGVAALLAMQRHNRKCQNADVKYPAVKGESKQVIIVENGIAREQEIQLHHTSVVN